MTFEIRFSPRARRNLHSICEYIAQILLAPDTAAAQIERIKRKIAGLKVFPMRYPLYSKGRKEGPRFFPVDNYIVLYDVHEEQGVVEILRIVYKTRNFGGFI